MGNWQDPGPHTRSQAVASDCNLIKQNLILGAHVSAAEASTINSNLKFSVVNFNFHTNFWATFEQLLEFWNNNIDEPVWYDYLYNTYAKWYLFNIKSLFKLLINLLHQKIESNLSNFLRKLEQLFDKIGATCGQPKINWRKGSTAVNSPKSSDRLKIPFRASLIGALWIIASLENTDSEVKTGGTKSDRHIHMCESSKGN